MAIKAKKAKINISRPNFEKMKKLWHFYYDILPLFFMIKVALIFLKYGLEMVLWPFLAFVAISRPTIKKMDKILSLSFLNLKKFLK